MTKQELQITKNNILKYVSARRLHDVFKELKKLAADLDSWDLSEKIARLEESYRMMLKYAVSGAEDPGREGVYNDIIASVYRLLDEMEREWSRKELSSAAYFSTLRYQEMQRSGSISQILARYKEQCDNSSLFNLITDSNVDEAAARDLTLEKESLEMKIFDKVWTSYPLSVDDATAIDGAFVSPALPAHFKQLLVSALFLGQMAYYDDARMRLLLNAYQHGDSAMAVKALCALLILMYRHRDRLTDKKFLNHLAAVKEMPKWHSDVKMIFMQIIKARDTERVSRKMHDELLPEMMKLRPDIYKKINDNTAIIDMNALEENPEWQEMLENSGLAEKMKELTELQEDGSDVFMSTFAQLKSYPFFNRVSNWFLPFYVEQSDVAAALGKNSVLGELIAASPFLCNSDKYSFALSMQSVPESQRTMMMSQLNAQNLNVAELRNAELLASDKKRENIANKYIQDLYRFFKLYRGKSSFDDPFRGAMNLSGVPELADEFSDPDTLSLIGEFYFKRQYYADACDVFMQLAAMTPPSAQLYQKIGYALQQNGDIAGALKYYRQSELLNADSLWTMRRIAHCHKLLGNANEALKYYRQIEAAKPEDTSVALNIGNCLLEQGAYAEALKYYYKVEFLDEKSTRAWRPIAWCSLLARDYDQSLRYYQKILNDKPQAADYLNMGHLSLAIGDYDGALSNYQSSVNADGVNVENFVKSINADVKYFDIIGIDRDIVPFFIDAVMYARES